MMCWLFQKNVKKDVKNDDPKDDSEVEEKPEMTESEIIHDPLTVNKYSRPGTKRPATLAVALHWTGNPNASAKANRDYFESRKNGTEGYGSAQYIVGLNGETICCIPDDEIAYHCGSSKLDPASGKIYTDYAREKFGKYAVDTVNLSPNLCTIGIEMCVKDAQGHFTDETWESTKSLVRFLLQKHGLATMDITTHNQIVGWKDCPRLFVTNPEEFDRFISEI